MVANWKIISKGNIRVVVNKSFIKKILQLKDMDFSFLINVYCNFKNSVHEQSTKKKSGKT